MVVMRRRQLLVASLAAAVGVACFVLMLLTHFRQPWMSVALLGSVGAAVLDWYWIVRPHQLHEKRLYGGRCVGCGYDLAGNASGVCPECGAPGGAS
jgi:hypothetical protein